jgi:hypothetical protein
MVRVRGFMRFRVVSWGKVDPIYSVRVRVSDGF